ncbi:MAG: efflux RND transporter periplasmic adaptor subunit [Anaerolineaceae bacterium]|nr:efflux RND transporter periplasmic adaptor subunit [Anaerolineaceae bacterium]
MTDAKKNQKKRRWGWWVVLAVVVIIGLVIVIRNRNNQVNLAESLSNLETEPYQRQNLNAGIYGTGTVESAQTAVLTWSASGIVGDITVSLGQSVHKDDVLMTLDPASVSADILQAQIDVINAQNNLDNLNTNWQADLAQAKLDLLKAQTDLDDLSTERKIMNYQRCSDERIEEFEDDLDQAQKTYDFFQNADTLKAVNTAQANLDYCMADFSESEVAEAELKVELAEAKVAELQDQVDLLSNGPDPEQTTILETQLAMAQSRMDSIQVEAPFDGVVTVLSVQPGDVVKAGAQAVQLDDLSHLFLDVQISEVDIPLVEIGQPAELVFDAYYEDTFSGEVVEISPVGSSIQGVVEYAVRIQLEDGDGKIKPGMTASVNIIVEEKDDVLVVPNSAIVTLDGQEQVFVNRNGNFVAVPVTLGSYSDYYSEIIEADIEEGELIVIDPPSELTGGDLPFGDTSGSPFSRMGN